ncbi:PH domain-containing protein [Aldersonia kunmingensis]|uniref:PH domain-containing protein n=1 Tax=Aldersonia kunmingensis TaxID=408066 RepID=UPI0016515F8C|nr:PH domain-containing protein [Aldersonia kunmingensis]
MSTPQDPQIQPSQSPDETSSEALTAAPATVRHVIRIQKLAYLAVIMLFISVSFPVIGWPAAFGWLLVIPIGVLVWVLRSRTTITTEGLVTQTVFGGQKVAWTDVEGVRFPKRGWARAHLRDGSEVTLPAVSFDRVRELAVASDGRIPDPYVGQPIEDPSPAEEGTSATTEDDATESSRNGSSE